MKNIYKLILLKINQDQRFRLALISLPFIIFMSSLCIGLIGSGNVGVRVSFSQISMSEITSGFYLKMPGVTKVYEYSAKENPIDLDDLTPKAKDNLSLRDFDVSIYYKVNEDKIADLLVKYSDFGSFIKSDEIYPGALLVTKIGRNAVFEEVSKFDSLIMHTKRDSLAMAIKIRMQDELNKNDPMAFEITRVIIRSILTDAAVEKSIQEAVNNQKRLESMEIQTEIAKKEADIKVTEARGVAESQRIISGSLTREYLQHEANNVMMEFAKKGGSNTVILQPGIAATPMINVGK